MRKLSAILVSMMVLSCMPAYVKGGKSDHCGPDRIPFDPDKKGCCNELQPDGTWKYVLTDDPKNEPDPCSKVPSDGAYGARICYNGEFYTCFYLGNLPESWRSNTNIVDCIKKHEKLHETQDGQFCPECRGKGEHTDEKFRRNECDAFQESLDCLRGRPWTEEIGELIRQINKKMEASPLKCHELE